MIQRSGQWMLLSLLALSLAVPMATMGVPVQAGEVRNSRLSQLIRKKPSMYLPSRMVIGIENKFTLQGNPGTQVVLYLSPDAEGMKAPDGQMLRVGTENQEVSGIIPDNGVLELTVPLPNEEELVGKNIFVEAIGWKSEDYSDLSVFELVDSTGRRSSENYLAISKQSNGKGAFVLPSMPGMPAGLMQQISNLSEIQNEGDPRKKELLDNGNIDRNNFMDRNIFINRPGASLTNPR